MTTEWLMFSILCVSGIVVLVSLAALVRALRDTTHAAKDAASEFLRMQEDRNREMGDLLAQFSYQICVPTDEQSELARTLESDGDGRGPRHKRYRPHPVPDIQGPMSGTESDID